MKKFLKNDNSFTCEKCGFKVEKLVYSSRDHCPNCLYSKHVDINPGDRKSDCLGMMKPTGIEKYKDTYKIVYICEKCNKTQKNIVAKDDNLDEIIKASIAN